MIRPDNTIAHQPRVIASLAGTQSLAMENDRAFGAGRRLRRKYSRSQRNEGAIMAGEDLYGRTHGHP